jgi:N6-adenosine-specific RNA methylase IME4
MDRTGNANGPHKRLKVMRQAIAIRSEPPPLPGKGPYRVVIADPPWPYEKRDDDPTHRGVLPYTTMSIDDICLTNVRSIAAPDCVLWLWVTNHHMREAFEVLDAWGFQQKTILTWVKDKMGMGDWLRGKSEHCLLAVRGRPIIEIKSHTTILHGKVRKHSQKPEEFYDMVESHSPAPRYAELWSRHKRRNWDGHGDEYPGAPSPQGLARVVEQLPRVAAEVDAAEQERVPAGKVPDSRSARSSGDLGDGLDIPACLDRRTSKGSP